MWWFFNRNKSKKEENPIIKIDESIGEDKIKKRVLSIDGGGLRGIYAAKVIASIEKELDIKFSEYFDVFCGVSTGSIIATLLYYGFTGEEIAKKYEELASKIFRDKKEEPSKNRKNIFFPTNIVPEKITETVEGVIDTVKGVFDAKYKIEDLKKILDKEFLSLSLPQEKNKELIILTYNKTLEETELLKYNAEEDDIKKLIDYVLASCAAPFYFSPHSIKQEEGKPDMKYLDGCVAARNPSLIMFNNQLNEGLNQEDIKLFSLGCVSGKVGHDYSLPFFKICDILFHSLEANTKLYDNILNKILGKNYYRIDENIDDYTYIDTVKNIENKIEQIDTRIKEEEESLRKFFSKN